MEFKEFDTTEIEQAKDEYREETERRWGNTPAYAQSVKKTNAYTKEDWQRITTEAEAIYGEFVQQMDKPPTDDAVRQTVKKWQDHITKNYYDCTDDILSGLGKMYIADERFTQNLDTHAAGLAQFMSAAIEAYCR